MAKKLVGFYRPVITEDMTDEAKEKAWNELIKNMVKDIMQASGGMTDELSEEEIDEIVTETLAERRGKS